MLIISIMNYSRAIRTIRAARGISQQDLAKYIKLNASYISRIESGDRVPTLEVVELISKELKIPLYLLTLLASDKEDLQGLPEKETKEIATNLLDILISDNKGK